MLVAVLSLFLVLSNPESEEPPTLLDIILPEIEETEPIGFEQPPMTPEEEHQLIMEIAAQIEQERAEAEAAAQAKAEAEAEAARQAEEAERLRKEQEQAQAAAEAPVQAAPPSRSVWDNLADCESGNWVNGGQSFETGSARWYWARPGTEVPPWGTTIHHGGLQFHPGTWSSYRLDGYPTYAYDASREQQIAVAERVLAAQGWGAWPTCARKLGLR